MTKRNRLQVSTTAHLSLLRAPRTSNCRTLAQHWLSWPTKKNTYSRKLDVYRLSHSHWRSTCLMGDLWCIHVCINTTGQYVSVQSAWRASVANILNKSFPHANALTSEHCEHPAKSKHSKLHHHTLGKSCFSAALGTRRGHVTGMLCVVLVCMDHFSGTVCIHQQHLSLQ